MISTDAEKKRRREAARTRCSELKRFHDTSRKGIVKCMYCDKNFNSPDRINIRICSPCKRSDAWSGSTEADACYGRADEIIRVPTDAEAGQKRGVRPHSIRKPRGDIPDYICKGEEDTHDKEHGK